MESHLLQMRGLKLWVERQRSIFHSSHLLQMRGLKQHEILNTVLDCGRIFYRCVD